MNERRYLVLFAPVMDPVAGGLGALLILACYASSNLWISGGGSASLAGGVHVAGWVAQFYGHWVHEGRSPALMDNLFQVLTSAQDSRCLVSACSARLGGEEAADRGVERSGSHVGEANRTNTRRGSVE